MSTSNQRLNSSASRPRATKRKKATSRPSVSKPKSSKVVRNSKVSQPRRSATRKLSTPARTNERAATRAGVSSSRRSNAPQKPGFLSSFSGGGSVAVVAASAVAGLAVIALVVFLILQQLPVFVISSINAEASSHVNAETIVKLASIEEGTTLLNVDVDQITSNIKRNPWVKDVTVSRQFPDTLSIGVEEKEVGAVVVIGAGASVWALSSDGTWIEPIQLDTNGVDVATAALARAQEMGCLLISDVPASVDPVQGSASTDASIQAVLTFQSELSSDITSQARVYYASSEGSISLVLDSGLEISLGAAEDINSKSLALSEIMSTYPNQLTYINVRVASKPTYRKVPDGTSIANVSEVVANNVATTASTTDSASTDDADSDDETTDSTDEDSSNSEDSE